MKKVWISLMAIALLSCMSGCIKDDNELELAIERDIQLIRDFLQRNNINAIENQLGYFYRKVNTNESGRQIVNNNILGVYYEIRTIDGQLIESYMDEAKVPRIYQHSESGLVPRGINFASSIAREGETLQLYIPSHLAYGGYSFQQLIQPNANLVVTIKFVKIYSLDEIKALEEEQIETFIANKGLEGFEKLTEGMYIRTVTEGNADSREAATGNLVRFIFSLTQMDIAIPFAPLPANANSFQVRIGNQLNQSFINLSISGTKVGQEIEVIIPSGLGFGATTQVFPFAIRQDLFDKGLILDLARPFEPVLFKARIISIS